MVTVQSQPASFTPAPPPTDVPPQENEKAPFIPPKLTFVTPKLTKQGSVEQLTAGIIGTFS